MADPSLVDSGEYSFVGVNADASITISVPLSNVDTGELDVGWLGIEITQPKQAADWLAQQLDGVQSIAIRLDRRRLDESGNLQAYVYLKDRLLSAELVTLGFAREDTHPSDFAPISRQIRKAKEPQQ